MGKSTVLNDKNRQSLIEKWCRPMEKQAIPDGKTENPWWENWKSLMGKLTMPDGKTKNSWWEKLTIPDGKTDNPWLESCNYWKNNLCLLSPLRLLPQRDPNQTGSV